MNKGDNAASLGLLQPLEVPDQAWSHISMAFIEGLPKSEGKDTIMVIVERFTKYSHFLALVIPFTASQVAKVFVDNVYKLHGMSVSIVSDIDKIFTSIFWKEFFKLVGTKLNFSTSYHPQSDGQTERVNQCLENYLRCMTSQQPKSGWSGYHWLSIGTIPISTMHLNYTLQGFVWVWSLSSLYRFIHAIYTAECDSVDGG